MGWCTGKRIGILMMSSPNIAAYAHQAALVNYMYASKHGYGFLVVRCPDATEMDADWAYDPHNEYVFVWSKARMLAHALRLFDVVLFIDSDAYVWDQSITVERKVEELMGPEGNGVCFAFAEDCYETGRCSGGGGGPGGSINAGVVLVRRSPMTSRILEHWNDPSRDCEEWKYTHPREQKCMDILRASYYSEHIRRVPVKEMNGLDGTWIKHLMATSDDDREIHLRDQVARHIRSIPNSACYTTWDVVGIALVCVALGFMLKRRTK